MNRDMLPLRSRRLAALATVTALGAGAAIATPAQAGLLGGVLPSLGTIVTPTGQTPGNLLPGVGGVVTGVTGTVGGVVDGVQGAVAGTLEQALGGVIGGGSGGLLPDDVLDSLLGTLLSSSSAAPGTPGTGGPGAGGPIVLAGGQAGPGGVVYLDASAPRPAVKVLSRLKSIGSNGKMRLEIGVNEPGVVALAGNVRPGTAAKRSKKSSAKRAKHSRKLIKVPTIVLGYRRAGKLTVTIKLSRAAQRALGRSRDARMSVGTVATDVFRNQDSDNVRLKIKR